MNSACRLEPPLGQRLLPTARARRGAVYFAELILVMPVFMVLLLAVVQFGIFFSNLQHLSFASRVGAEAASETGVGATVPTSVISAVEEHLEANGINNCNIVLQSLAAPTVETGGCNCSPSGFNVPLGDYARVTVCVRQKDLMPNLLAPFGYNIDSDDLVVSCSTTMQREF